MSKKSDFLIDQEYWIKYHCYLNSPGATFEEKLGNARKISEFVFGGKPAEIINIDGGKEMAATDPIPQPMWPPLIVDVP